MGLELIAASLLGGGAAWLGAKRSEEEATYAKQQERKKEYYIDPAAGGMMTGDQYDYWITHDHNAREGQFIRYDLYKAQQAEAEARKAEAEARKAEDELEKNLNILSGFDVSGELAQYEKDLMNSFMESVSPQVRQWAYERGLAGSSAEQDLMAKATSQAAKQAALNKYSLQQQFAAQKEALKSDVLNLYKTRAGQSANIWNTLMNLWSSTKSAATSSKDTYDWSNLLTGLSKDIVSISRWNELKDMWRRPSSNKDYWNMPGTTF